MMSSSTPGPAAASPPETIAGATVIAGPERVGSEQRWTLRLPDGREAVVGCLLPELARDESLRRRYVHDVERVAALAERVASRGGGLARILDHGPKPDPRDPGAAPPWRLRAHPPGETLARWLERRAPAPIDELAALVAALADVVHRVHGAGAVIRDLHPRNIVLPSGPEGGPPTLTDTGLARVDILSSRTASSLILEGSPYASPEQLLRTALDPRSDVFGLGVLLFQGLTGELPFGDGPALLRTADEAPPVSRLRPEVPPALEQLIARCLSPDPEARPESASELARVLRGEQDGGRGRALARASCQSCGATLRMGQRLCLACGKQAVVFQHAPRGAGRHAINLVKATEDAAFMTRLRGFLEAVSDGPVPALNLIIGDRRMYSKEEQAQRDSLPLRLFNDLTLETANNLAARMREQSFQVKVIEPSKRALDRSTKVAMAVIAGIATAVAVMLLAVSAPAAAFGVFAGVMALVIVIVGLTGRARARKAVYHPAFLKLRAAPAALPASDPLVARLAAALEGGAPDDVREQLGELALLVQRLVDHRARLHDTAELERVTEPIEPLVTLIERHVAGLRAIDHELAGLDEGAMVRALAASEARGEPRASRGAILDGLDRLRALEERRAALLHRLLEASNLMRRAVDLGLGVRDEVAEHEARVQLALQALADP